MKKTNQITTYRRILKTKKLNFFTSAYKVTPSVLEIGDPLNVPGLNLIYIHPSEQFLSSTKSIDISPGKPPKEACLDSSEAAL